jgi:hypothetical protein
VNDRVRSCSFIRRSERTGNHSHFWCCRLCLPLTHFVCMHAQPGGPSLCGLQGGLVDSTVFVFAVPRMVGELQ